MNKNKGGFRALRFAIVLFIGAFFVDIPGASGQNDNDDTTQDAQALRVTKVFDFGAFCVEGIPIGAVTSVGRPELHADGFWREISIAINDTQKSKPHIFFLSGVSRRAGVLSACGKSLPKDVSRILEGDLDTGTLTFRLLVHPFAGLATAEQIESGGMDVVLTNVHLQFAPLYGGQILAKTLKVTNIGEFIANPQKGDKRDDEILKGVLKVGSQRLQIVGAKIRLPGAPDSVTANLSPGADGSAILVEIPTGHVSLFNGTQSSTPLTSAVATKLLAAGLDVDARQWKLAHIVLTAYGDRKKPPILSFQDLKIDASHVVHGNTPFVDATPDGLLSIGEAVGALAPDSGEASSGSYVIRTLLIPKAKLKIGGNVNAPAITGQGSIRVREIDDANLDGDIEIPSPELSALNGITAIAGSSLTVHTTGPKATPKINGDLGLNSATIAALTLQGLTRSKLTFASPDAINDEFGLTFSINATPQSGHWQFADPTGAQVMLDGDLKTLAAKGTVWFGTGQRPPRIAIDPGTFRFAAQASVVRDSIIFGAPADHIQISPNLDVSSPNGIVIAKTGVSGSVEAEAGLLVVGAPQLSFEIRDQGLFRINAPLRFDTGATIAVDLSTRVVTLIDGHAEVSNTSATAIDANQSATLAGIEVHAPSISLTHLSIVANKGMASVGLTGLTFQATALVHAADPTWNATNATTTIGQLDATLAEVNNAVQLKEDSMSDLKLSAEGGAYTSHDGFNITGQQMAVAIAAATRASVTNAEIGISSGKLAVYTANAGATASANASYDAFHVTATGTSDDINGTIHLHVTGINGAYEFPALKDKCPNDLKLRLSVEIGSFAIDGAVQHGDAHGRAIVNDPKANLQKTANDVCEWNEGYDVSVPRTVLVTVCWIPVIGDAICNAVQKVVNVNVRVPVRWRAQAVALNVGIKSDNVAIALSGKQGTSVCVSGARVDLDAVRRIQTLTVTPTFEAHGELANLVKKVWDFAFQVTEGLLTTSLISSLTDVASLITAIFPVDHCG